VDIQLYWIETNHVLLTIAGMGYTTYSLTLANVAKSLRPLTAEEKSNITAVRIRLVEAQENETLQSLSERTGNVWDIETTALMNGSDQSGPIQAGTVIKIAIKEPYNN